MAHLSIDSPLGPLMLTGDGTALTSVGWGRFDHDEPDAVLVETAEKAGEIDVPRAESARKRAEERLKKPPSDADMVRAQAALQRALARLQVAGHRQSP